MAKIYEFACDVTKTGNLLQTKFIPGIQTKHRSNGLSSLTFLSTMSNILVYF